MSGRARSILVGYDGSDSARRALDAAVNMAGYGTTLAVVSVSPEGRPVLRGPLLEARERLVRKQVQASYFDQVGDPANELVETARMLAVDLVVVGRRRGVAEPTVPDSVSARVFRDAPCDVLVVR